MSSEAIKILDDDDDPNIGAEFNSVSEMQHSVVGSKPLLQPHSIIEQSDDHYEDKLIETGNKAGEKDAMNESKIDNFGADDQIVTQSRHTSDKFASVKKSSRNSQAAHSMRSKNNRSEIR